MSSLICIGASAGGYDALSQILTDLPADFRPTVVMVLHLPADSRSVLAESLSSRTTLPVREPEDKEEMRAGTVYVAPPGYHLLVERNRSFSLSVEPPVHYSRPSIDVLFESAAIAFGSQVVGIILTGANQDGAAGLKAVVDREGLGIVQEPSTALYPMMPEAAIKLARPHHILPLPEISKHLRQIQMNLEVTR